MMFLIAETFTDSLGRLMAEEQKAAKNTAFDLQLNPASPGLSFHRLDKGRDRNFWSVRVSRDIRLIVHRDDSSMLLCYVDHHDRAYDWAERRKIEIHPRTGAAQIVEVRETVKEIVIPAYVQGEPTVAPKKPVSTLPLFTGVPEEDLLGYGVPAEWLADVHAATEESLLALADHLPAEAAEALLELATGGKPTKPQPAAGSSPFAHPDAQRRFRVMTNVEELRQALEFPWDKWSVFLHPEQRQTVEKSYNGPARVSGSAGTGKTIVALHRAVFLARENPDARVLLTTYSPILANALRSQLRRLISNEPRLADRLDVASVDLIGDRLYRSQVGPVHLASRVDVRAQLLEGAARVPRHRFSEQFLLTEWEQVVDAWGIETWEAYRDVARLGRKTRLPEPQRAILWAIYERVRASLSAKSLMTRAEMFTKLSAALSSSKNLPFDFVVVDEAQDMGVPHMRFFASLGAHRPDALFFVGDLGQRIFQQPFSWLALGVDIRGRSKTLKVNYRTSHQIRRQADRLLGPEVSDADGNTEVREHTVSVFNGPEPEIAVLPSGKEECSHVAAWLRERASEGFAPHEFGVFVRSEAQTERARAAVLEAGLPFKVLDENVETTSGQLSISTMHLAKGLEFRAVVVMACDDEVIPLQERIETVADDADLEDVFNTERHLLYVACTRARDRLLVTAASPASVFLDDLRG